MKLLYDGIMLSIEAIKKFSPDPEHIRKGFKSLPRWQAGMELEGITSDIEFDKLGDREMEWRLVDISGQY